MTLTWLVGLTTGLLLFFNLDFMTVSFLTRTSTREVGQVLLQLCEVKVLCGVKMHDALD